MLGASGVRVRLSGCQRGGRRIKALLPLICGRWMGLVTRNWGERRRKLPIVGGVACLPINSSVIKDPFLLVLCS